MNAEFRGIAMTRSRWQRTVMDNVPRHNGQRGAAEAER
jgi:hypothetical protein